MRPHAMHLRRDALLGASFLIQEVNRLGKGTNNRAPRRHDRQPPNSRTSCPGNGVLGRFSRYRHCRSGPDGAGPACAAARIAQEQSLAIDIRQTVFFRPVTSTRRAWPRCAREPRAGYHHMDIVSGAGHDAVYIAGVAPTP